MRHIVILLVTIAIISTIGCGHRGHQKIIYGGDYYVFPDTQWALVSVPDWKSRYTPTKQDIEITNQIISSETKNLLFDFYRMIYYKSPLNKKQKLELINNYSFSDYYKQYIGFVDKSNNKIIKVFFIRKDYIVNAKSLTQEIYSICGDEWLDLDMWDIIVNITTKQIIEVRVTQ